ncbi:Uncharacterised protein [uncultured archaeon]|nr:Uncharacterised protein [uncultured archaeon]
MLLNIARFRVDVFAEARRIFGAGNIEFAVPEQVLAEMEKLSGKSMKLKKEISIARELMAKNGAKTGKIDARGADEALKKLAVKGAIVATNDKELKDSVRELNGKVLCLRQSKFLVLLE